MKIIFIHPNFPAQFRHLAYALGQNPRHMVLFVTSNPRPEWEIPGVQKIIYKSPQKEPFSANDNTNNDLINEGRAVLETLLQLKKQGVKPDLIYAHSGWGTTFFIKDVFPHTPFLGYFEWYYNPHGKDMTFGNSKVTVSKATTLRLKNLPILNDLLSCQAGTTPTRWQFMQFPELFHHKLHIIHDGINTSFFKPGNRDLTSLNLDIPEDASIVTYATRGMEPYRGFPQFIESIPYILKENKKCHIIIAGEDRVCYGTPRKDGKTWKTFMLEKVPLDSTRVHSVGSLPYGKYLKLLQASDVHVYLTRPFVLSWSMLEAMSCGCVVVASDTEPVREVIKEGVNGFLTDFFNPEQIAHKVLSVLSYPSFVKQISSNARETIINRFSLQKLLPAHLKLIFSYCLREQANR